MKDTVVRQREADAWELRLAGVSQVEIARRLNLTAGGVSKLLARLYARVDDDLRRGAAAHRAVLFARLEALYGESRREWLASCAAGRANFKLAQTAIRALAEESKLLGLAAPVRLALDVNDDEQPEPPAVDLSRLDEDEVIALRSLMRKARVLPDADDERDTRPVARLPFRRTVQ